MLVEFETYSNTDGETTLYLDCFSYQTSDFESVNRVLRKSAAQYSQVRIDQAPDKRIAIRYSFVGKNIQKLENFLKFSFTSDKDESQRDGVPFMCKRVQPLNNATGCKTIYTTDIDSANLLCGIVAKKHGWFGAVAKHGTCVP